VQAALVVVATCLMLLLLLLLALLLVLQHHLAVHLLAPGQPASGQRLHLLNTVQHRH
jgi:hypothetical protein